MLFSLKRRLQVKQLQFLIYKAKEKPKTHKVVPKQVHIFITVLHTHTLGAEGVAPPSLHTTKWQLKDIFGDKLHIRKKRSG